MMLMRTMRSWSPNEDTTETRNPTETRKGAVSVFSVSPWRFRVSVV